jgi:uncharacterized protein (DUF362 family)
MDRRNFLTKSIGAGVIAGAGMKMGAFNPLSAAPAPEAAKPVDLVAVKGGETIQMFDKAIAVLGGIGRYVKPGQTVVVKPNIGWDKTPEFAATTNPQLVGHVVSLCLKAGAKKVYVFDNTCDKWQNCYKNSGIESAVKQAGGQMVPGNDESYYKDIALPHGVQLKKAKEHKLLQEANVFINIPVLKNHGGATMSIAIKNLMGVIWDRGFYHKNDLHQCLADYLTHRKPTLNIIDAYRVMKRNGPKGVSTGDVIVMKSMIVSSDIVAADAAATKLFGLEPEQIGHIAKAYKMGLGEIDLSKLNIQRLKI